MKKVLLVLMAAVLLVACASCAKNDATTEVKKEMFTVNVYNRAGADLTKVELKDNAEKGEAASTDKIANGEKAGISVTAAVNEKTGLPDLMLSYAIGDGTQASQTLTFGTGKTLDVTINADGLVNGAPQE